MERGHDAEVEQQLVVNPHQLYFSASLLVLYVVLAITKQGWRYVRERRQKIFHTSLPPSPPPLRRLSELNTPDTTGPTRTPTPPFSISKTIKRTRGQPQRQQSNSSSLTPGDSSAYDLTPYTSPSVEPAEQRDQDADAGAAAASASPKGWDPALLQQCAQNEALISSVEGLQRSAELQQHIRATTAHQNFDLHMKQVETKLNTYRDLRAFDRDNFVHAYTRKDIMEFDEVPPHLVLLILDHASSAVLMASLLLSYLHSQPYSPVLLATWLGLQALLAWRASHFSLVACAASIYCVYGDDRYAAHQVAAGPVRTGLAALLDLALVCCSLGVSSLVSLVLVCLLPLRQSLGQRLMRIYPVREGLGQRLMRIYPVREIAKPAETPLFTGSPSKLIRPSNAGEAPPKSPYGQIQRGPMLSPAHMGAPQHSTMHVSNKSSRFSQQQQLFPTPGAWATPAQQITPENQPIPSHQHQQQQPLYNFSSGRADLPWEEELAAFSARRSLPRSPIGNLAPTISKRKHE
ncbi:hypothetical protein DUNSADRAFT_14127 [Dunaliella salina]|uniref:Uncharacterized protein n=1 Tax=Dunaliella salina TaxID=3046 RepID=A0ABQ7G800_DUNSA|nr:hypothetical protein DUNSADRAFT_14127 [Dunaliella salina]|eukprot:KAF5830721.1 hypothetical protein DUNSADRAFT_14127 [Dunaliella salina]